MRNGLLQIQRKPIDLMLKSRYSARRFIDEPLFSAHVFLLL
jgi:hypothetical protein